MKSLTIGICSYQRRESLLRLIGALDDDARQRPQTWRGVDVCVVLDGSDDGSREALDDFSASFPLHVVWQPNRGLATARNTLIEAAAGEVIWFLDDDLVPAAGTLDRHRAIHESEPDCFLLGPCLVPPEMDVPDGVRQWWIEHYGSLEKPDGAATFDQFFIANASAPAAAIRAVGGFDEKFVGYGWEDFEFGARALAKGIREKYDPRAVAWHYTTTDDTVAFGRQRMIGHNAAQMFKLHPELAASYFPADYPRKLHRLLDKFRVYSPRPLWAIAVVAHAISDRGGRLSRLGDFQGIAWDAAYLAGIAATDRGVLIEALGRPESVRTGRERSQPAIGTKEPGS